MAASEPYDDTAPSEANEADVAEQQATIDEPGVAAVSADSEADPADALEQAQVVGDDDDYPHDAADA